MPKLTAHRKARDTRARDSTDLLRTLVMRSASDLGLDVSEFEQLVERVTRVCWDDCGGAEIVHVAEELCRLETVAAEFVVLGIKLLRNFTATLCPTCLGPYDGAGKVHNAPPRTWKTHKGPRRSGKKKQHK